jgi:hypothetical protein
VALVQSAVKGPGGSMHRGDVDYVWCGVFSSRILVRGVKVSRSLLRGREDRDRDRLAWRARRAAHVNLELSVCLAYRPCARVA